MGREPALPEFKLYRHTRGSPVAMRAGLSGRLEYQDIWDSTLDALCLELASNDRVSVTAVRDSRPEESVEVQQLRHGAL